jgi:hypothetical protein
VNAEEQKVYRLELKLIRKHFKGLRLRPVKLVKKLELGAHGEAAEPTLTIKDAKRSREELETLLKHELILVADLLRAAVRLSASILRPTPYTS